MVGLGNTRGIVLQYNSGLTELQGIGQNISHGEFYWRELIMSTRGRERIVKLQNFNKSNKVAILVKKSQHGCIRLALREHLTSPCHDFACGG